MSSPAIQEAKYDPGQVQQRRSRPTFFSVTTLTESMISPTSSQVLLQPRPVSAERAPHPPHGMPSRSPRPLSSSAATGPASSR
eukprot:CAMPEP_0114262794 /NCGR_PEP_ID=MMETSP0058-20121206/22046_1 /TAXON_ID=36894 /ORGANISM="Pyramimonas parkeae, CCMP726" /LENGTH=82 /DNA_ID=CAMNT_0001378791 /DNA_START=66 /DNA_END=311 /DNA_ORIENTATION=+